MNFNSQIPLKKIGTIFQGDFKAFDSSCKVQIETADEYAANDIFNCISNEALRISNKYSLSIADNMINLINRGTADSIIVDEETAGLIDFADICFQLSEGRFDASCLLLQPEAKSQQINKKSGWEKIRWDNPRLRLLQGMKLNFDAFSKEHACDRSMALATEISSVPILIDLGGNILANKPRVMTNDWWIEIATAGSAADNESLQIGCGGIATANNSTTNAYFDGRNCQHVEGAAKSITVTAPSCTEAGMLSILAMLYGDKAEVFLEQQQAKHWIYR